MKRAFAALALAALVFGTAAAEHCTGPSTSTPLLTFHWVGGHGAYVVFEADCVAGIELCDLIVYEEANGVAGLQRLDDHADDTCHGAIPADRIAVA